MRKVTCHLWALTAGLVLAASGAFAVDTTMMVVAADNNGKPYPGLLLGIFTNQAVTTTSASSVSATCPLGAQYLKFWTGTAGDFRAKPNGSGVPPTGNVTDGTAWPTNPNKDILPINTTVSGTTVSSYAVNSATAANTVPYDCMRKTTK